MMNLRC